MNCKLEFDIQRYRIRIKRPYKNPIVRTRFEIYFHMNHTFEKFFEIQKKRRVKELLVCGFLRKLEADDHKGSCDCRDVMLLVMKFSALAHPSYDRTMKFLFSYFGTYGPITKRERACIFCDDIAWPLNKNRCSGCEIMTCENPSCAFTKCFFCEREICEYCALEFRHGCKKSCSFCSKHFPCDRVLICGICTKAISKKNLTVHEFWKNHWRFSFGFKLWWIFYENL